MNTRELVSAAKSKMPPLLLTRAGRLTEPVITVAEFLRDAVRYCAVSAGRDNTVLPKDGELRMEAQLTKDYHRVEKGLTLPAPKRPFGSKVKDRIDLLLPSARGQSAAAGHVAFAQDAVKALDAWNHDGEISEVTSPIGAGLVPGLDSDLLREMFESRKSIRNFDRNRPVDIATIDTAIGLARNTPSVCNRQAARVHIFREPSDVQAVLSHQNGNSGFGQTVDSVLVVTVNSVLFTGPNERNQRWIDGGLFAMSLGWALHGLGVQWCMLNWSMGNGDSARLRSDAGIPNHEDIIMMIALGYASEDARVARSPRRPLEEIVTIHHGMQTVK